uniref:Uncharacterized protein n=1 Tax=Acrobeloides nanus TaxID=290746 RepID=A0A914D8C7_9BILA
MCLKHLVIFLISISVAFAVTCHQSCTPGTNDCPTYSQQCRDVYCTYMRSVHLYEGNYTETKLACNYEALLQPDINSPAFTTLNTCTRIVYNGVEYTMKICDNADYCNDDCVPVQKQQPGYVTCKQSCTPESNCPSNNQFQCSDYYCTYMKTVYQNNYTVTKQTCSDIARLQPGQNNPAFTAVNQCIRNTYFGVEYTMKICNTDYCSDTCDFNQNPSPSPSPSSAHYGMISISLLVILMIFNL